MLTTVAGTTGGQLRFYCNSKISGQCSTWMIRQLSAVTACTRVRGTRHSCPTNGCVPPTVRISSRFFQHLSNP